MWERIDITDDFNKAEKKQRRKKKFRDFINWCGEHTEVAAGGFIAGLGLVTAGIKAAGRAHSKHMDLMSKDLRCYDNSLGRYWVLKRKLTNRDWLEIDRRKSHGERLGDILDDLRVLK